MRDIFKEKAKTWFVVGGLLLVMSITSVGYVQAGVLTDEEIYWLAYMREEEKLNPIYAALQSTEKALHATSHQAPFLDAVEV